MVPRTEIAWAAGFWDGEGCFSVHDRKPDPKRYIHHHFFSIQGGITQKHREVLDRFQKAVGFGKVYGPYQGKNPCPWSYRVSGKDCFKVIKSLWPYLGSVKKDQIGQVLSRLRAAPDGLPALASEQGRA